VVEAARKNKVKQIIYLSGLGTSSEATTGYYQSKWRAEETIRNSGLIYTILRASVIFGPEDQFINRFLKIIKTSPVVPIFGDGQYQLQPISVDDVAQLLTASLNNRKAHNETVEVGGPDRLAFTEIIELLKRHLNKRRINIYLPWWLMRFGAGLAEKLVKPAPVTRDQLSMLMDGSVCDNRKMHEIFDIKLTRLTESLKLYKR
jgi:NADH dehydrogenase